MQAYTKYYYCRLYSPWRKCWRINRQMNGQMDGKLNPYIMPCWKQAWYKRLMDYICMEIYFVGTVLAELTRKLIGSTTTICLYKIYLHTNPITSINEIPFCFSHFHLPSWSSHPSQTCPLQCHFTSEYVSLIMAKNKLIKHKQFKGFTWFIADQSPKKKAKLQQE